MNGFWTGGSNAYGKALQKQYDEELDKLEHQLDVAATESEEQAIEQQIARLTETYRVKTQAARRSIF